MYETLAARLPAERMPWVAEESAARLRAGLPVPPHRYYADIKGAWRLDLEGLQRLQRLAAWREQTARELNRPRGRVIKDDVLKQIAEQPPKRAAELSRWLPAGAVRSFGDALLEVLQAAPDADAPGARLPQPLPTSLGGETSTLRSALGAEAQALGIAEELLARRRLVEQLVRAVHDGLPLPDEFRGWRAAPLRRAAAAAGDLGARIIGLLDAT